MRCHRVTARSVSTIVTVPLLGALIGCQQGPQVVTSIVFDGESRSITTTDVFCTNQLNGGLVIWCRTRQREPFGFNSRSRADSWFKRQACATAT